jgi:PUB domain
VGSSTHTFVLVLQAREPSHAAPAAAAPPAAYRLGGSAPAAPAARTAAEAAELRQHQAHLERRRAAAEAAVGASIDVATAYEGTVDAKTAGEEAALAALGGLSTEAAQAEEAATATAQRADSVSAAAAAPTRQPVMGNITCGAPQVSASAEQRQGALSAASQPAECISGVGQHQPASHTAGLQRPANHPLDDIAHETSSAEGAMQVDGTELDASAASAASAHIVDTDAALAEDPSVQRAQQVQAILQAVPADNGAQAALQTVATIVANALRHPQDGKYKHVRRGNRVFSNRVARWPQVEQLLQLAGFVLDQSSDAWSLGKRDDPAMLWLVHSLLASHGVILNSAAAA